MSPKQIELSQHLTKKFTACGRTFTISAYIGEVIETSTSSIARVKGSGGGSALYGFGIKDVSIKTQVETKTKIWVVDLDGQEEEWVCDGEVSVRKGQKILAVSVSNGRKSCKAFVKNLVSSDTGTVSSTLGLVGRFHINTIYYIMIPGTFMAFTFLVGPCGLPLPAFGLALPVVPAIYAIMRFMSFKGVFNASLDGLKKEMGV